MSDERAYIFEKAARLDEELEELRAEHEKVIARLEGELQAERGLARLWRGRAADLKAVADGIVMDGTSSRQDVQSKLLLALQRNEW